MKIITLVFAMFTQRSHLLQKYNNLCKHNCNPAEVSESNIRSSAYNKQLTLLSYNSTGSQSELKISGRSLKNILKRRGHSFTSQAAAIEGVSSQL